MRMNRILAPRALAAALAATALAATTLPLALAGCARAAAAAEASGSFEATEVTVSAEASGRILAFAAEEGQALEAGKVLGSIDASQLVLRRRQLLASKSSVESRRSDADLQLASIREQIDAAAKERLRLQNLVKANAASKKQLDDVEAQIAALEKQEAAQRTTIANANSGVGWESSSLDLQVAQLDDQIAKCSFSSPISGTLLDKYAEPGEYAAQGKALFKAADLRRMYLRAYVPASILSRIALGQDARVTVDFGEKDSREYAGKVSWISSEAEFTPKTAQTRDERASLVYAVKVAVDNDGLLKIGMYGKARFGE